MYYVQHNDQQLGPFTEAEVRQKLAAGEISATDLVWWEGQENWQVLNQTPLAVAGSVSVPVAGLPPVTAQPVSGSPTSKLAIWALVCGCISFLCGLFAAIPAIILGHLALGEIKKNPVLSGKGMAIAGLVLGYLLTVLTVLYVVLILTHLHTPFPVVRNH